MKATLPGGILLEGTVEEISETVQRIQGKGVNSIGGLDDPNNERAQRKAEGGRATEVWTTRRAKALWEWLYGNQKKLLEFLLEKGGRATQADIMRHLGLKKGNELAGIRSCITRNARRETGYKDAVVLDWALGDDGKWCYKIVPEVRDLLTQVVDGKEKS